MKERLTVRDQSDWERRRQADAFRDYDPLTEIYGDSMIPSEDRGPLLLVTLGIVIILAVGLYFFSY